MTKAAGKQAIRTNDPQGVRRRILDAAADLFQQRGYNATGMQDLFARAAITSGAFYHHFATKHDLALTVIRERIADAIDTAWLQPLRAAPTAWEGISAAFNGVIADLDANQAVRGCPVSNLTLEMAYDDPAFRHELKIVFDLWRRAIADRLAQDGAATRSADPQADADYVVAVYCGAMALCKVEQSAAPLRNSLSLLAQAFSAAAPLAAKRKR